ncbi:MAG TPA: peptide ABC transporter substrate-binding protein, partial [Stellaceae bacterium]|nr:peptide ABC transporter substrate-binding protein [Stellaceae bacterium]
MRRRAFLLIAALGLLVSLAGPALARSQLVIGVSQFPPSLNPLIDSTLAKSYVLGMARRPIT